MYGTCKFAIILDLLYIDAPDESQLVVLLVVVPRSLRLAAYFQFTWWVHGYLGRGNRRVIPSCVVSAIRERYPEASGEYQGFQEADLDEEAFWPL